MEKETAVILNYVDQLHQNLARVHYLLGSFLLFLLFPLFSIVHLLSVFCSKFDTRSEVQDVYGKI